jgi:hypothetical protein
MTPDMLTIACRQAAYDVIGTEWPESDSDMHDLLTRVADAVREVVLAAYGEPKP